MKLLADVELVVSQQTSGPSQLNWSDSEDQTKAQKGLWGHLASGGSAGAPGGQRSS